MKHLVILIMTLTALSMAGLSQPVQQGPYTVYPLEEGIYRIEDSNDSNPPGVHLDENNQMTGMNNCSDMYLIAGTEKAMLIDLSNAIDWDATATESLRSLVYDRVKGKDLYITLTHRHGDHLGMLPAFAEDSKATFWIPKAEFHGMDIFPEARTIRFPENASFNLGGGVVLNTMEVPGHTAHSTLFFLKDKNMVFSGDAIGSGSGVWLFDEESFYAYEEAVDRLIQYIEDPENHINPDKLRIYGGHFWQCKPFGTLTSQYIYDMQILIKKIRKGTAKTEPMSTFISFLDTNFTYGTATISWNKEAAKNCHERTN
jgi:glyoxylase-like metal-dependent hydrolase (beta-lactamase superfamily II)